MGISSKVLLAAPTNSSISITINNSPAEVDPPPQMKNGAVLVPLRGVLEKLGAKINYNAEKQQISVQQGGRTFLLGINVASAELNQIEIPLTAAPVVDKGSTFVPLRSLAELFGYQVQWQGDTKTVQINNLPSINHQAALDKLGHFGVTINVLDLADQDDAKLVLDAARAANAAFIKIRFDWSSLEPTQGAPFAWDLFDYIVRGASERGMGVVGVLGNSTQWASIYQNSTNADQWRNAPPLEKYFPDWDNYVRRVVGRYRDKVHAWQIWEYPASYNFRSGSKDYRAIVRRGAVMANLVDADALVFAGEPGGVDLTFLHDMKSDGMDKVTKGVMLHPLSQWQPGVPTDPAAFLLPHSTLLANKNQQYWADAVSYPVLSENTPGQKIFYSDDAALLKRLKSTFTPQDQASYLVKTFTLALAAGMPKSAWGNLRDDSSYPKVDPVNPDTNSGLMTHDMQSRLSYQAFTNLSKLLQKSSYVGAVSKGPHAVILVFSDGTQSNAVAWADDSKPVLDLQTGAPDNAQRKNALYLATTKGSETFTQTGYPLTVNNKVASSGVTHVILGENPLWITNLDPNFVANLKAEKQGNLTALNTATNASFAEGVSADFSADHSGENGLYWKKYADFRGEALPYDRNGVSGLITTVSRDVYNPAAGNPNIYLDVDDSYMYDEAGVPVKVTIKLYRPPFTGTDVFRPKGGFNIQYDSPNGSLFTPWQEVEQGTGIVTYTFHLPRVSFANSNGYDMIINTWGSKQDMVFQSVTVQRETLNTVANPTEKPDTQ